ncbi:MAG: c-type cytochrome [Planctomycetota bacterium]
MILILSVFLYAVDPAAQDTASNFALLQQLREELPAKLSEEAATKGDPVRGAIHFSQKAVNCATCHAAGQADRVGPDLTKISLQGEELRLHLIESLLYPSKKIKEGYESSKILTVDAQVIAGRILREENNTLTIRESSASNRLIEVSKDDIVAVRRDDISAMPENLVDQLENRQAFLDLLQYLEGIANSRGKASVSEGNRKPLPTRLHGIALLDQYGCANCHHDLQTRDGIFSGVPKKTGPDLYRIAVRTSGSYIRQFILDPQRTKPGTRMPAALHHLDNVKGRQVAEAITHYLVSLGQKSSQSEVAPVAFSTESAERGREAFHHVGCVACHSPRNESDQETMAEQSVALGRLEAKYTSASQLVAFLKDPHAARPSGRMPNLGLDHWEAVDIANYLLGPQIKTRDPGPWVVDVAQVESGRQHFESYGCSNCHVIEARKQNTRHVVLADLEAGCLAPTASANKESNHPRFALKEDERESMILALSFRDLELGDQDRVLVSLAALRCTSCHSRDSFGGVSDLRDLHFHTDNENLGPQGRLPPTLTNVGAKLKPKWLRDVLVNDKSIRPYMHTRMPQYGEQNLQRLIELLPEIDEIPEVEIASFEDVKETRKIATDMIGNQGLNCIACHTFQEKPAQTMPAVDLTEMSDRLQPQWFHAYMLAPQSLSPNTVMPSFWPGGKAMRKQFFEGDSTKQISAIWEYLQDGRQARRPRGLITEPIRLLAGPDRAVMLRRSYPNIGKRGIGVGYSNQGNLAFDAEQMRLAMLWKGDFADPGGVWRGQGHGTVRPLARPSLMVKGPDFDSLETPWVADDGRPPEHRFQGYILDKNGRPTFRYRFGNIEVRDYVVDIPPKPNSAPSPGQVQLRRHIEFETQTEQNNLRFRLLSGGEVEDLGAGIFRVGETRVILRSDFGTRLEGKDRESELQVLIDELPQGVTTLEVDYVL